VTGGCCPSGQIPCGISKCYDPKTQICCSDGISACPLVKTACRGLLSLWQIPCGSSKCYDPKILKCCSGLERFGDVRFLQIAATVRCVLRGGEQCCENGSCPERIHAVRISVVSRLRTAERMGGVRENDVDADADPTLSSTQSSTSPRFSTPSSTQSSTTPRFSTPKPPSLSSTPTSATLSSSLPTIIFPYLPGLTDDVSPGLSLFIIGSR